MSLSGAGFLAWERRARYPMLPLAYFWRRAFWTPNAVIFFQFVSLIGVIGAAPAPSKRQLAVPCGPAGPVRVARR